MHMEFTGMTVQLHVADGAAARGGMSDCLVVRPTSDPMPMTHSSNGSSSRGTGSCTSFNPISRERSMDGYDSVFATSKPPGSRSWTRGLR